MPAQIKPLILVDGSSYLYRAFHALPALTNSKGFPTGAVYGMVNMLKRLIADYQPEHMAVVFDAKGKTFRDEIYTEYKATRQEMPNDLVQQVEPIHRIIAALGLPILMVDNVEADDVIGTLATNAALDGIPVLISTSDKDLAQFVSPQITLINTMTNVLLDRDGVIKKFGVPPELIIDYLTLVGDTSDNIPGVPLVGPKTAVKLIQTYGTLANIMEHASEVTGKVGENLRASLEQLPLTKKLVTIKLDVALPLTYKDLKLQPADKPSLINLYKAMEFKTWLSELLSEVKELTHEKYTQYLILTDKEKFEEFIAGLALSSQFVFDIQTSSEHYMNANIIGLAFAAEAGKGIYIPLNHHYEGAARQLDEREVLSQLKPILENTSIQKIGHNIKYKIEVLAKYGIQLKGIAFDTMLESYVLDSTSSNHDLNSLALKYLGWSPITLEDIAGKGSKQRPFAEIEIEKAGVFAAEDADITLRLHHLLWPRIQQTKGLKTVFESIEMPLVDVLACMERCGVLIDANLLRQHGQTMQKRLLELEAEAFTQAGKQFNMNSPKQLQEILFQILNLPVLQKTPTGQPSTADGVLQELAMDFAMPRLIIEYRSLSKLISTYTNSLVEQIDQNTKRVHTFYNQSATATGRLSSSEPNLQNIPIRSVEGRRIRQAFIAPEKHRIISADYSQIELRLMAHISNDPNLLKAFANNLDIHIATAAEVWDVPLEKVTSDMRRNAKAINFGLIYGMSAFGLTRQLGIDRKSAQEYIDRYFQRYPNVKAYMDNTRLKAKKDGYVETLWGRRLYLPDINSAQIPRQKAAERVAINAPLQGSAADIIKLAMIRIQRWIREEHVPVRMVMQVHDELVFEAPDDNLNEVIQAISNHMSQVASLKVPLVVSVGIGPNWDEASNH